MNKPLLKMIREFKQNSTVFQTQQGKFSKLF